MSSAWFESVCAHLTASRPLLSIKKSVSKRSSPQCGACWWDSCGIRWRRTFSSRAEITGARTTPRAVSGITCRRGSVGSRQAILDFAAISASGNVCWARRTTAPSSAWDRCRCRRCSWLERCCRQWRTWSRRISWARASDLRGGDKRYGEHNQQRRLRSTRSTPRLALRRRAGPDVSANRATLVTILLRSRIENRLTRRWRLAGVHHED